jgi:hypothetical protein
LSAFLLLAGAFVHFSLKKPNDLFFHARVFFLTEFLEALVDGIGHLPNQYASHGAMLPRVVLAVKENALPAGAAAA